MVTRFELPERLIAEHAGRALALSVQHDAEIYAATSLAGAGALAAARHLHNLGYATTVTLADANAHSHETFSAMLEVIGCMDLPLRQGEPSGTGCVIAGTDLDLPPGAVDARPFLESSHSLQWDGWTYENNPFVKPAREEDARPAAVVREIDRLTMEDYSLAGVCLMENAAIGAAVIASEMLKDRPGDRPVVCLVGTGNNGGDALAVARGLLERGESVKVLTLGDPLDLKGDARENLFLLSGQKGLVEPVGDKSAQLEATLGSARLIVDGLFGTGLARPVEGLAARVIETVNRSCVPVLALDLPSGMHADTGEVLGTAVKAARTVTFAAPKPGLFADPELCGAVDCASIGCPRELL